MESPGPRVAPRTARGGHEVDHQLVNQQQAEHHHPLGQEVHHVLHVTEAASQGGRLRPGEAVAHNEDDEVGDSEPLEDSGHSQAGQSDPAAQSVEDEPEQPELDRPHRHLPYDGLHGRLSPDGGPH